MILREGNEVPILKVVVLLPCRTSIGQRTHSERTRVRIELVYGGANNTTPYRNLHLVNIS